MSPRFKKPTLAIVDDEAIILESWKEAFDGKFSVELFSDPIAARHFFDQQRNRGIVEQLLAQGVNWPKIELSRLQQSQSLVGKTFVISGTLAGLSRDQAAKLLKQRGARVSGSVSAKTTALISGESPGSKLAKAEALGVEILDQAGFERLVGD